MFENKSEQDSFLEHYNISQETFLNSHLDWYVLSQIANDYESEERKSELEATADECVTVLQKCPQVHSLKARRKEVDHLIEKIIRKNPEYLANNRLISVNNYRELITDLIGIRMVYLFKDSWEDIHDYIHNHFADRYYETPFAYVVSGDEENRYIAKGLEVRKRNDYRSVHYVIKCDCAYVEIQVRTLAEEVWGEIDHELRYPLNKKNEVLGQYMALMSTLTGCVDSMATFVSHYINRFDIQDTSSYKNQVYNSIMKELDKVQDNKEIVENIREIIRNEECYQELKNTRDILDKVIKGSSIDERD